MGLFNYKKPEEVWNDINAALTPLLVPGEQVIQYGLAQQAASGWYFLLAGVFSSLMNKYYAVVITNTRLFLFETNFIDFTLKNYTELNLADLKTIKYSPGIIYRSIALRLHDGSKIKLSTHKSFFKRWGDPISVINQYVQKEA